MRMLRPALAERLHTAQLALDGTTCEHIIKLCKQYLALLTAESLVLSFTAISGYGAVEILNRQKHRGRADWRLSASGASYSDAASSERMTIQEAVETASLLRREAHVARNASAAGAG